MYMKTLEKNLDRNSNMNMKMEKYIDLKAKTILILENHLKIDLLLKNINSGVKIYQSL